MPDKLQKFFKLEKLGLKIERKKSGIYFWISVRPNSSETKIEKVENEILKIFIKNPPIDNLANIELVKFLKKEFGFESVEILVGKKSRKKKIFAEISQNS
ncbi:MAG: hypothetical protein Fur0024_4400 [Patescibacteria group bacterium]